MEALRNRPDVPEEPSWELCGGSAMVVVVLAGRKGADLYRCCWPKMGGSLLRSDEVGTKLPRGRAHDSPMAEVANWKSTQMVELLKVGNCTDICSIEEGIILLSG